MTELLLRGMFPAFPTPRRADGSVNSRGIERLVEHQIREGAAGLVPVGGTGEAPSLTLAERQHVVDVTVSAASGRVPVVAGILDAGFGGALDSAEVYTKAGASGLLVIAPYYFRADQEAVKRYFRDARKAIKLPIVLYDNPFRTNTVITPETIATMAHEGIIVGMKASSTDLYHLDHVAQRVGVEFGILSGQDTLFVEQVLLGARGGILTSACLIPSYWNAIQADAERGRVKEALAAQRRLYPFLDALFAGEFPVGVKAAFELLGLPIGKCITPTGGMLASHMKRLEAAITDLQMAGILRRF